MNTRTRLGCALALLLASASAALAQPGTTAKRPLSTTNLSLTVAGVAPFALRAAEGGDTRLVQSGVATTGTSRQVVLETKVEPLDLTVALGTATGSKESADWLKQQVSGGPASGQGFSGSVVASSADGQPMMELSFTDAITTSFALDTLDAASKDAANVHVVVQPAASSWNLKPTGGKQGTPSPKQKAALASNFRVTLPGMPTARVVKVEGVGAERSVAAVGPGRAQSTGEWSAHAVTLTISATDMEPYVTWLNEAIAGQSAATAGKALTIELLDPTMKDALITFTGDNARIVRAAVAFGTPGSEKAATGEVELIVDRWTMK